MGTLFDDEVRNKEETHRAFERRGDDAMECGMSVLWYGTGDTTKNVNFHNPNKTLFER